MDMHPPFKPAPPGPTIEQLMERMVRFETRLVRLMSHLGLDQDGNPKGSPVTVRVKPRGYGGSD